VLLHGRGRTPGEMIAIADQLHITGMRWVAPAAKSGSWYPHRFMRELDWNEPDLTGAIEQCGSALREASEDGRLGPDKLVLLGFSQGACIATEYALRHPGEVAAIIVFTGCVIGPPDEDREWGKKVTSLNHLQVLITGSDWDEWIPEEITRTTAELFEQLGAEVHLHVYHGRPHIVSEDEIQEARVLLQSLAL
jgi:phospholipase/carboxylesterase